MTLLSPFVLTVLAIYGLWTIIIKILKFIVFDSKLEELHELIKERGGDVSKKELEILLRDF